jgi:hypothetical protein
LNFENENEWHGCYDDGWQGIIVPEAFAHPAKMSYALTRRIFKHALGEGWIKPGDVVVDPFGGIGSTGLVGACEKIKVISVELEPRFCIMAAKNYLLHCQKGWCTCGQNGRSYMRKLRKEISKETERDSLQQEKKDDKDLLFSIMLETKPQSDKTEKGQSALERGQICLSKNGIHNDSDRQNISGRACNCDGETHRTKNQKRRNCPSQKRKYTGQQNGKSSTNDNRQTSMFSQSGRQKSPEKKETCPTCGKFIVPFPIHIQGDSRQLSEIIGRAECIVGSPPFCQSEPCQDDNFRLNDGRKAPPQGQGGYGQTPGQLGREQGETFWSAAQQIVSECHKILKPQGFAIWVCKRFVRKGEIVEFSQDWTRLCESSGFKVVCWHKAMLVKETVQDDLFGGKIIKKVERKSFFRRLAEAKNSPRIDWEDVICMRRVGQGALFQ